MKREDWYGLAFGVVGALAVLGFVAYSVNNPRLSDCTALQRSIVKLSEFRIGVEETARQMPEQSDEVAGGLAGAGYFEVSRILTLPRDLSDQATIAWQDYRSAVDGVADKTGRYLLQLRHLVSEAGGREKGCRLVV